MSLYMMGRIWDTGSGGATRLHVREEVCMRRTERTRDGGGRRGSISRSAKCPARVLLTTSFKILLLALYIVRYSLDVVLKSLAMCMVSQYNVYIYHENSFQKAFLISLGVGIPISSAISSKIPPCPGSFGEVVAASPAVIAYSS